MTQACCFALWSGPSGLLRHVIPEFKISGPKTVVLVPTLGSFPGRLSPTVSQGNSPPMTWFVGRSSPLPLGDLCWPLGSQPSRFQKEETQCLLEHLLHMLALFPPPSLAEKGLDATVAGMFSTKGLQGYTGPVCPWPVVCCLLSSSPCLVCGSPSASAPSPASVSCCFNEGLASCAWRLSSSAFN